MNDILNKSLVLVLNRNWQAVNVRTPQEAFCMMAANVATGLDIEGENHPSSVASSPGNDSVFEAGPLVNQPVGELPLRRVDIRPVTWDEWITLPIRRQDNAVRTVRGPIRVPMVIVAVNYARVPKKRPKLCARAIRERDGNRCQYTGRVLRLEEGSLDHVVPRSRGGKNAWENLVWAGKDVNARKGNRLPQEAGLRLLSVPRAPKELPVTALLRNAHGIPEWKLFVGK
jgi:5-methylcytosine-specific restriction endonuclease McrA